MPENETEKSSGLTNRPSKRATDADSGESSAAERRGWKVRIRNWWQSVWRVLSFLLPGNVSRIHYYEARERYFSLKRVVQHEKGLIPQDGRDAEQERSWKTLLLCETILDADACLLTRRQENLNRLWRSLTRVTVMLINNVWTEKQLAAQLNVCREEAYRLRIEDDPAIGNFLQQIAEIIDESGDLGERKPRVKRALVAAWERFNSIRTRRIHDQYIMSQTYLAAFFFLLVISFMIISNHEIITQDWDQAKSVPAQEQPAAWQQDGSEGASEIPEGIAAENVDAESAAPADGASAKTDDIEEQAADVQAGPVDLIDQFNDYLSRNILAFIYLGGLAGGFFSVVTRISRHELAPGADAYFIQYILTKPFVGAFGAIVLFILVAGGLTSFETVAQNIRLDSNGTVFGAAFLLGFSERFAFPNISPP